MVHRSQRGLTLVETLVAVVLLGFAILMAAAIVTWALRVDAKASQRALALDLGRSAMEVVRALPYALVQPQELDTSLLAPAALPDPSVAVEVDEDAALGVKEVTVKVAWGGPHAGTLVLESAIGAHGPYR